MKRLRERLSKNSILFWDNAFNLFALSIITGLFVGVIITFYNILMHLGEDAAEKLYALFVQNPVFIPLLFLGLAAGALVIGTAVRFVPMARGSGIPQIEGAARGVVRFKWYVTLCTMFAASLACVCIGYPAGAEGPSLEIGGSVGGGVTSVLKRNQMVKRLQIASGASAGFAVAFNAPITGMVFALEEAFRSFSAQMFICASISVVTALLTSNAIRPALGFGTGFSFNTFVFNEITFGGEDAIFFLWTALASVITALVGVGFYYFALLSRKVFKKITFLQNTGKFIIPFLIAGAFSLITAYAIGGGHGFIDDLGTNGTGHIQVEQIFGCGVIATLIIVVVFRFITSAFSIGCGVPCGVFVPMLAIGAGLGAALSVLFQSAGMDGRYSDYLVIICMAVLFTCVVKAPITGIVMVFELTGQFANFLPALMGIAIGYLIGMLFKTEALYEKLLSLYIKDEKLHDKVKKIRVRVHVMPDSKADGAVVRNLIWPSNGLVVSLISEEGKNIVPDGETVIRAGQTVVFECETDDKDELLGYLYALVGKPE